MEAVWIMPDGKKWGLQSKYFEVFDASKKPQLKNSLDSAIRNHQEINRYTFVFPIQLSGPTATNTKKPRSGSHVLLSRWIDEWSKELASKGKNISIDYWDSTELSGRFQEIDSSGGRRHYWFDETILSKDWFTQHLEDATAQAGNRYTPELSLYVPLLGVLEAFGLTAIFEKESRKSLKELIRLQETLFKMPQISERSQAWGGPPIPSDLKPKVQIASKKLKNISRRIHDFLNNPDAPLDQDYIEELNSLIELLRECEPNLLAQLQEQYGEAADSPGFRQYLAEHRNSFPAENLDSIRQAIYALESFCDGDIGKKLTYAGSKNMLVRGPAGIGKTHALVDYALSRSQRNLRSIILFGEDFSADEPWYRIGAKLGLGTSIGRDELIAILEAAAEASGGKLVLIIDALNETEPNRQKWKAWYPVLTEQIGRTENLKLLVSCRDVYLSETLPDWTKIPNQLHNGFVGREYEVVPRFFDHYGLEKPAFPIFQTEFGNPLFLHFLCQSLKSHGLNSVPLGGVGFSRVVEEFLNAKNQSIASDLNYHQGERKVHLAVEDLAKQMNSNQTQRLTIEVAKEAVTKSCPNLELSTKLFDALEKESIIAVLPGGQSRFGQSQNYIVRFIFERLTDHLRATNYLSDVRKEDIGSLFKSEGVLSYAVTDADSLAENRGILESLSILLPERYGLELPEVVDQPAISPHLEEVVLGTLDWRLPESFSKSTDVILQNAFQKPATISQAVSALLSASARPGHPFNADRLHRILRSHPLSLRDAYWPLSIHELFEANGKAKQVINWALESNLESLEIESARLWATTLAWFCAASDRRVRDRATKALVRVSLSQPQILPRIVAQFANCDDDYVRERVLVSTLGALLLRREPTVISKVSIEVWDRFFSDSNEIPLHASIRDHARLILELALDMDVLPPSACPDRFRPPYSSDWPMKLPSQEDVQPFLDDKSRYPIQMNLDVQFGMARGTDFARYKIDTYVIRRFEDSEGILDRSGILRWFLKSAADIGYPCERNLAAYYDHLMNEKYGAGRGRVGWAERIGKKYYWILLNRLLGQISDHLPLSRSWGDARTTDVSPIQALSLRDIDPTDLRAFENKSYELVVGDWYTKAPNNFYESQTNDDKESAIASNLPNPIDALIVTQPDEGQDWVALSSYCSWTHSSSDDLDESGPYRKVGRYIWSAFVSNQDCTKLHQKLGEVEFQPDTHGLGPEDYRGYIAEYPSNFTCRQRIDSEEISEETKLCGVKVRTTSMVHLKGKEWEYDFSQDLQDSKSLEVPARDFLIQNNLSWDGNSGWWSKDGSLCAVHTRGDGDNQVLLIRKSLADKYLAQNDMSLVWIVLQENMILTEGLTNGTGPVIQKDMWSVYQLDGGLSSYIGGKEIERPPDSI